MANPFLRSGWNVSWIFQIWKSELFSIFIGNHDATDARKLLHSAVRNCRNPPVNGGGEENRRKIKKHSGIDNVENMV